MMAKELFRGQRDITAGRTLVLYTANPGLILCTTCVPVCKLSLIFECRARSKLGVYVAQNSKGKKKYNKRDSY